MNELSTPEAAAFLYAEMEWGGDWAEYYSYLHPDAQAVIPEQAMIGWYENSFQPMDPAGFSITNVSYVTWTWGVTGESYRNTAKVSYWQLDPNHGNGGYGDVMHLVEHDGAWRWFFGRSREFIEEQIRLYGNSDSASSTWPDNSADTSQREQSAVTGCTLVELHPGYPGYQGYVTGVEGIGDHACLEDLEARNANFSKTREDKANLDAARAIGLSGGPDLWTWENWMQIEAERGMTPTCYTCAGFAGIRAEPTGTGIGYDDPRLILGMGSLGTVTIHRAWERENGLSTWASRRTTDFELMIIVRTFNGPLNAEEVIEIAMDSLGGLYGTTNGTASRVDTQGAWDRMVERGGYFDVPGSAAIDDQLAIMFLSVLGLEQCMGFQNADYLRTKLTSAMDDWLLELSTGDYRGSFAEYLQDLDAEDWY